MKVGFVVEGTHDELKVQEVFQTHFPHFTPLFALTHGTRYNNRTRMNIQAVVEQTTHIFYLLDSDDFGDKIYETLSQEFDFPRIVLDIEQTKSVRGSKTKIGVEHASTDYLYEVLKPLLSQVRKQDKLLKFGETYGMDSKRISELLNN